MTIPTMQSIKSSANRDNSRSRSRSRSNRKRNRNDRKHRGKNVKRPHNHNSNTMELDSDDNELLEITNTTTTTTATSTSSTSTFTPSSNSSIESNIVRGPNRNNNTINNSPKKQQCTTSLVMEIEHIQQNDNTEQTDLSQPHLQQNQNQLTHHQEHRNGDEQKQNHQNSTSQQEEQREFRFSIENDHNLQEIIAANSFESEANDVSLTRSIYHNHHHQDESNINRNELTSEYILSKLYNYMKISEMSKYGISVFEMTFSSYLPYLNESDIYKLATSYWCNGQHFNCMISHRGDIIKSDRSNLLYSSILDSYDMDGGDTMNDVNNGSKERLRLQINNDLLDSAMQSGASVDKIEAMLIQKRIDDGVYIKHTKKAKNKKNTAFYHTKSESKFYLRNLKHRFWNHEVLVRVFIQNGWLTPNLAETAMKRFIKTIYHRVLDSKVANFNNNNRANPGHSNRNHHGSNIKFSENFLHSFFVSYFCLDDIPKMYKQEIQERISKNEQYISPQISEETLRRWCELIELLASRGANLNEQQFKKCIPLQYALQIGRNTYKIISTSYNYKNTQYLNHDINVPNDIWDVLTSYL